MGAGGRWLGRREGKVKYLQSLIPLAILKFTAQLCIKIRLWNGPVLFI